MFVKASQIDPGQAAPGARSDATSVRQSAAAAVAASVPAESAESLQEAVAAINRVAKSLNNSVELSLDTQSGRTLVKVMDSETGELIRQIPSEEALELRRALERIAGLLIHRTA